MATPKARRATYQDALDAPWIDDARVRAEPFGLLWADVEPPAQ